MKREILFIFIFAFIGSSCAQSLVELYSISPPSGFVNTTVYINVSNSAPFSSGSSCYFGDVQTPVLSVSSGLVVCAAPPNDVGTIPVDLYSPYANTTAPSVFFTYQGPSVFIGTLDLFADGPSTIRMNGSFVVGSEYICVGDNLDAANPTGSPRFSIYASTVAQSPDFILCTNWTIDGPFFPTANVTFSAFDVDADVDLWMNVTAYATLAEPPVRTFGSFNLFQEQGRTLKVSGSFDPNGQYACKLSPLSIASIYTQDPFNTSASFELWSPAQNVTGGLQCSSWAVDGVYSDNRNVIFQVVDLANGVLLFSNYTPMFVTNAVAPTEVVGTSDYSDPLHRALLINGSFPAGMYTCRLRNDSLGILISANVTAQNDTSSLMCRDWVKLSGPAVPVGTYLNFELWSVDLGMQIYRNVTPVFVQGIYTDVSPRTSYINCTSYESTPTSPTTCAATLLDDDGRPALTRTSSTSIQSMTMPPSPPGSYPECTLPNVASVTLSANILSGSIGVYCPTWVGILCNGVKAASSVVIQRAPALQTPGVWLNPTSASSKGGDTVTFIGSYFNQTAHNFTCKFGSFVQTATYLSPSGVSCTVPENAVSGPIVPLLSRDGGNTWLTSPSGTQFTFMPHLQSVSPTLLLASGTSVTVQGYGFEGLDGRLFCILDTPVGATADPANNVTATIIDKNTAVCLVTGRYPNVNVSLYLRSPFGSLGQAVAQFQVDCEPGQFWNNATRSCQNCAGGFYGNARNLLNCTACPVGQYSGPRSTQCGDCPMGTYASTPGTAICTQCSSDFVALQQGQAQCARCPFGSQFFNVSYCEPCVEGRYWQTSTFQCVQCPAGNYSSVRNVSSCQTCPAGQFSTVGSTQCTTCSKGTYAAPGSGACTACPSPLVALADGAGQCTQCPFGTQYVNSSYCEPCVEGYFWNNASVTCDACPAGKYSPTRNVSSCLTCPAGQFSTTGSTQCTTCLAGTYAAPGSGACTACPSPLVSLADGAGQCSQCPFGTQYSNASHCEPCAEGYYWDNATVTCVACPSGKYSPTRNVSSCLTCAPGLISSPGATFCSTCLKGTYATPGNGSCAVCPAPTVALVDGAGECTQCPFGSQYVNGSYCEPCVEGYFWNNASVTCDACPAGKYSPTRNVSSCLTCPAGQFSTTGSAQCSTCQAGTFAAPESGACTACPSPLVAVADGAGQCAQCPFGTQYVNTTFCEACVEGYFWNSTTFTCDFCPAGQYNDMRNVSSCNICPAGQFSTIGSTQCNQCPIGTFSNSGSGNCSVCPAPLVALSTGLGECVACPYGSKYIGPSQCETCAPGTAYNTITGACDICTAGHFSAAYNSSTCDACPVGQFSGPGATQCLNCPLGEYANATGSASCRSCPVPSVAVFAGSSECSTCPFGSLYVNSTTCEFCPNGQYTDSISPCKACTQRIQSASFGNDGTFIAINLDWVPLFTNVSEAMTKLRSNTSLLSSGPLAMILTLPVYNATMGTVAVNCSQYIHPVDLPLLGQATCSIQNTVFRIALGQTSRMAPNDTIRFNADAFAPVKSCPTPSSTWLPVRVNQAAAPAVPILTLATSSNTSLIPYCESLPITIASSDVCNGRNYRMQITVTTNRVNSTELPAIKSLFSMAQLPTAPVTLTGMRPDTTYVIQFNMQNCLLQNSSASLVVSTSPVIIKSLVLDGPSYFNATRSDAVQIRAVPEFHTCHRPLVAPVTFQWKQVANTAGLLIPIPNATIPVDRASLTFPTRFFTTYGTYAFQLTATASPINALSASASFLIYSLPLSLSIRGGDRFVTFPDGVTIDATAQDPDQSPEPALYAWTCATTTGGACSFSLPSSAGLSLTLPSNTLQARTQYVFTLTFTKGSRSVSASVTISCVVDAMPPTVTIQPLASSKVNPAKSLMLSAVAISKFTLSYRWSASGGLNLENSAIAPSGSRSSVLAISPNSLTPGRTYIFTANATDVAGTGSTSITVLVNSPPSAGTIQVSPSTGEALRTTFTVTASGFVDSDAPGSPLTYDVSYVNDPQSPIPFAVQTGKSSDTVTVTLPEGKYPNSTCYVIVTAYDMEGGQVSVNTTVNVNAIVFASTAEKTSFVADQSSVAESLVQSGSVSEALSALASLADAVNTIDISEPEVATNTNTTATPNDGGSTPVGANNSTAATTPVVDTAALQKKQELQEKLVNVLQTATTGNVVTATSVVQTTSVLSKIADKPEDMTPAAKQGALAVFDNLFSSAATNTEIAVDTKVLQQAGSTLSKIADALFTETVATTTTTQNTTTSTSNGGTPGTNANNSTASAAAASAAVTQQQKQMAQSFVNTLNNIASSVSNGLLPGQPPIVISTPSLQISAVRKLPEAMSGANLTLPTPPGAKVAPQFSVPSNFGSLLKSASSSAEVVDTQLLFIKQNPYSWSPSSQNITSSLISMTVKAGTSEIKVENLAEPIVITIPRTGKTKEQMLASLGLNASLAAEATLEPECRFWNETTLGWSTDGCTPSASMSNENVTVCLCNHLTQFASFSSVNLLKYLPDMNLINFSDDTSRLSKAENLEPTTVIFLGLLCLAYFFLMYIGRRKDREDYKKFQPTFVENLKKTKELEREMLQAKLASSESPATGFMQIMNRAVGKSSGFWHKIKDSFKEDHLYLSVWFRPQSDTFTRPQRATIVFTMILATLVANALFYGRDMVTDEQRVLSGVISAIIVTPVPTVIGAMFIYARPLKKRWSLGKKSAKDTIQAWTDTEDVRNADFQSLASHFEKFEDKEKKRSAKYQEFRRLLNMLPSDGGMSHPTPSDSCSSTPRSEDSSLQSACTSPLASGRLPGTPHASDSDRSLLRPGPNQSRPISANSVQFSVQKTSYELLPSAPSTQLTGAEVAPLPMDVRRAHIFYSFLNFAFLGLNVACVVWSVSYIPDDSFKSVPSWLCFVSCAVNLINIIRFRKLLRKYQGFSKGNPVVREDTEKHFMRTLGFTAGTFVLALAQGGATLLLYQEYIPPEVQGAFVGLTVIAWFFLIWWLRKTYVPFITEEDRYWPHWWVYVGYAVCWTFSAFAIYILILYGTNFKHDTAQSWLFSSLLGMSQDIFLQQPLSIVGSAVLSQVMTEDMRAMMSSLMDRFRSAFF